MCHEITVNTLRTPCDTVISYRYDKEAAAEYGLVEVRIFGTDSSDISMMDGITRTMIMCTSINLCFVKRQDVMTSCVIRIHC